MKEMIEIVDEELTKKIQDSLSRNNGPLQLSGGVSPISPAHYQQGGYQTWDVIYAWGLDYFLGNVVKYISRAGKKDPDKTIEDLEKARAYLDKEIELLRRKENGKD